MFTTLELGAVMRAGPQKNGRAQQYPVVDDFAEFLLRTPESERAGFVFTPVGSSGKSTRRVDTVSDWIVAIGKKAGVKADMKKPRRKNHRTSWSRSTRQPMT